jgi:hypothetical protein
LVGGLQVLTEAQICENTRWLLENASGPLRYLTRVNLLGEAADTEGMPALWRLVEQDPASIEIFSKQRQDGVLMQWWILGAAADLHPERWLHASEPAVCDDRVASLHTR